MELFYLLNQGSVGSTIFLILPALLIIGLFLYFKKKKDIENSGGSKFGRRGSKDHAWQILKEYHKQIKKPGRTIIEKHLFERPSPGELHDALAKGMFFKYKEELRKSGKKVSIFQRKPKYPKRFDEIEDYFEELEKNTMNNRQEISTSQKIEQIRANTEKKKNNRKRYVILYKTEQKKIGISDWKMEEVELIKQVSKDGKTKDSVVMYCGDLNKEHEMVWIGPLLKARQFEQSKRDEEMRKKMKRIAFYRKIGSVFKKPKKGNS